MEYLAGSGSPKPLRCLSIEALSTNHLPTMLKHACKSCQNEHAMRARFESKRPGAAILTRFLHLGRTKIVIAAHGP